MNSHSSHRAASFLVRKLRLRLVPLLAFALGAALPLALGAMDADRAPSDASGRIGLHRKLPNSLLFHYRDEILVLTYHGDERSQKIGPATFYGTVHAVRLTEALQRVRKAGAAPRRSAPDAPARRSAPSAAELRPAEPSRTPPPSSRRDP